MDSKVDTVRETLCVDFKAETMGGTLGVDYIDYRRDSRCGSYRRDYQRILVWILR